MIGSGKRDAYSVEEVRVGEILNVFARGFEILSPDEKTIRYMEQDPDKFPYASYGRIMSCMLPLSSQVLDSLKSSLASLYDFQQSDQVSPAHLKEALRCVGIEIGLHEALTIVRELSGAWERPMSLSSSPRLSNNIQGNGANMTVGIEKILSAFQGLTMNVPSAEALRSSQPQQDQDQKLQRHHSYDGGAIDFAYQNQAGDQPKVRFSEPGHESHLKNIKSNKSNLVAPFLGIKQPASLWQTTNQKAFRY